MSLWGWCLLCKVRRVEVGLLSVRCVRCRGLARFSAWNGAKELGAQSSEDRLRDGVSEDEV